MQSTTIRKRELRQLGQEIATAIDGKSVDPFIGTWLQRDGLSIDIRLTSDQYGRRVVIHKWSDEDTCSVRLVTGDFWRDPSNAHEFANQIDVAFTVEAISEVATEMVATTREP